jgi:hypothetical protein
MAMTPNTTFVTLDRTTVLIGQLLEARITPIRWFGAAIVCILDDLGRLNSLSPIGRSVAHASDSDEGPSNTARYVPVVQLDHRVLIRSIRSVGVSSLAHLGVLWNHLCFDCSPQHWRKWCASELGRQRSRISSFEFDVSCLLVCLLFSHLATQSSYICIHTSRD